VIASCAGGGSAIFAENIRDPDSAELVSSLWAACFGCLATVIGVVLGLVTPFVLATYAETGDFGAALRVGTIFQMAWKNIGPAFIVLLMSALAGVAASIAGSILCGIGLFATSFYAQLVTGHLSAQLYMQAKQKAM
jgi:hypothetical protein